MLKRLRDEELTNRLREIARNGKPCPPIVSLLKRFHVHYRRFWRIVDADDELRRYFAVRRGRRGWSRISDEAVRDALLEIARNRGPCPPIKQLLKRLHTTGGRFFTPPGEDSGESSMRTTNYARTSRRVKAVAVGSGSATRPSATFSLRSPAAEGPARPSYPC